MDFMLKEGRRCRFFLNPRLGGGYVAALDTDIDPNSVWAVEDLALGEPANSPPLFKTEAEKLAIEFCKAHEHPGLNASQVQAYEKSPGSKDMPRIEPEQEIFEFGLVLGAASDSCYVRFWFQPRSENDFWGDAEILVRGDRTIDPHSWIAIGELKKVTDLGPRDVGRAYWMDGDFGRAKGTIQSIDAKQVVFRDTLSLSSPDQWVSKAIPLGQIRSIREILPAP